MMRRIVTSFGRTAFRSRNFKALRMSARDEPAGFGANTGLNVHSMDQGQTKGSWTADAKDQIHDFKEDAKLTQQKGEAKAYQADTQKAANEGMTLNKDQTLHITDVNKAAKNTAGNSPHDTFKPWEAKEGQNKPQTNTSGANWQKSPNMADAMRTTGSTNQSQASSHVHNQECGYGEKCAPGTTNKSAQTSSHVHGAECGYGEKCAPSSGNQYESKNIGAKTCVNDSTACRMEGGKCVTHKSQEYGQSGSKFQEGGGRAGTEWHAGGQKTDEGMMDKAMNWVKEKLGGSTQQTTQDSKQTNNCNDKKEELRRDQHLKH